MNGYSLLLDDDNEIISEIRVGDSELGATAFVRKYQNFVYSTALRFLQSYDDADDVSQEVFIKALKYLPKFRGDSSLKTWLYKITKNICITNIRKKKMLSFFKRIDEVDYFSIPDTDYNPEQKYNYNEFESTFLKAMAKLPEKQRETFAMRYFDQLSYEEISNILGTTVGGLKANYYQAVKKLANVLKPNNTDTDS